MKDAVVLLPTYNERGNVGRTIDEIFIHAPGIHVCVIDDSSPDGTADVVRRYIQTYPTLELIVRKKKTGLGDAYKAGYAHVSKHDYRYVITMDADGSHNPKDIPRMLNAMQTYDLVVGSRYVLGGKIQDWELWRRLLSAGGNMYTRMVTGMQIKDTTSGFVCVRRELVRNIDFVGIHASGYAYQIECKWQCWRAGAVIGEIPITFLPRREGESKLSHHTIFEAIKLPWRLRSKKY